MTDQFERRLRDADPATRDVESSRTPRARALMEQIMSESTIEASTTDRTTPGSSSRRLILAVAAAAIVVAGIVAAVTTGGDDDTTTLALRADSSDATLSSCLAVSAAVLAPVDVAFDAEVTSVDGSTVTLDVSRWYQGGDADTVTVENPDAGKAALIDGVDFAVGERYLVSATGGAVNSCGLSGVFSPQLEALYVDAFPG